MSLETMTKLATATAAGGESLITFSNIPQGYTDLIIKYSAALNQSGNNAAFYFNSEASGTNYAVESVRWYNTTVDTFGTDSGRGNIYTQAVGNTTSVFGNGEITILNYSGNTSKCCNVFAVSEANSSTTYNNLITAQWSSTAPITSISFYDYGAGWTINSTFTLYGVKAQRTAVGNSIKANGGAISFDGTYVYHAFNATDTFTPTTNLVADLLVVGGGGSGGTAGGVTAGGGGGAGGVSYQPNTPLILGSSYPVTIGAGGAGGATGYTAGPDGSNSTFSTFTGFGGGGGGAGYTGTQGIANGRSGGSGGGGGSLSTTSTGTGGSATQTTSGTNIGYGNAGGIGRHSAGSYVAGGGGGGSGEAGVSAVAAAPTTGGRGGDGTTAFSTWKVGQLVSGTYYLAGGGGGCGARDS